MSEGQRRELPPKVKINEKPDLERTRYFSRLALRYKSEMKILEEGAVLGKDGREWRNIAAHCLFEAACVDTLAEVLGLSDEQRDQLSRAAILHDWYKRREIEAMREDGVTLGYAKASAESKAQLHELGVKDEIIQLTSAIIPDSLDPEYLKSRPLGEKIIHYIDAITETTNLVDVATRMQAGLSRSPNVQAWSETFRPQFSGLTLHEAQTQVGLQEEQEFKEALGLDETQSLIEYLRQKIDQKVHAAV